MTASQFLRMVILLAVFRWGKASLAAEPSPVPAAPTPAQWADFVEADFPFYSSSLDARTVGRAPATNNLTPRGLILNLGNNHWACFDTELLRMSAIWYGAGVSATSMSRISYKSPGTKAREGQEDLPRILGTPWLLNGIYPGWQIGPAFSLTDPREPGPDAAEVGRGPLPKAAGQFRAVRLLDAGVQLEYEIDGVLVSEVVRAVPERGRRGVQRQFHLNRVPHPLWLLLGSTTGDLTPNIQVELADSTPEDIRSLELINRPEGFYAVQLPAMEIPLDFRVSLGPDRTAFDRTIPRSAAPSLPSTRWPQEITTSWTMSSGTNAWEVDSLQLPVDNPWRRNVRLADLAFFADGRAAAVTFDGDVWLIDGLGAELREVRWHRFASGLHEPQGLVIRDGEIFVFDRNGLWCLRDTDGNKEADVHQLFSNAFGQTAETREYAQALKLAPDGSFLLAKGGIQMSHLGKDNGAILRIAPDGQSTHVIARGLRAPYLGVHPRSGVITASDQQGHYVPATPIHLIRENQFHGFLSSLLPEEKYPAPITEPWVWIPYPVNASGASQAWLVDARMGPLNETMIHFGYYRPEIFAVLSNPQRSPTQAAVVSVTRDLNFPPMSGAVNPIDGQLYFTGFQIFGSSAPQISGLGRLRYTGAPATLPREVIALTNGIFLCFDVKLDERTARDPGNYIAEHWNYRRTSGYGSPHFKLDGSKGQETQIPSSAYLSKDRKCVFLGIPGMKPAMQLRVGWQLKTAAGQPFTQNAYLTPSELAPFDSTAEGFENLTIDLTPRSGVPTVRVPATAGAGKRVAELMGCSACHSTDGTVLGKVGPTWKGLFGSTVTMADGTHIPATESYLRESIQAPAARIVQGFQDSETAMPSYEGVLAEDQLEALITYLKTL